MIVPTPQGRLAFIGAVGAFLLSLLLQAFEAQTGALAWRAAMMAAVAVGVQSRRMRVYMVPRPEAGDLSAAIRRAEWAARLGLGLLFGAALALFLTGGEHGLPLLAPAAMALTGALLVDLPTAAIAPKLKAIEPPRY